MPKMMQIVCMNSCASGVTVEAAEMSILNYFQNENSDTCICLRVHLEDCAVVSEGI